MFCVVIDHENETKQHKQKFDFHIHCVTLYTTKNGNTFFKKNFIGV